MVVCLGLTSTMESPKQGSFSLQAFSPSWEHIWACLVSNWCYLRLAHNLDLLDSDWWLSLTDHRSEHWVSLFPLCHLLMHMCHSSDTYSASRSWCICFLKKGEGITSSFSYNLEYIWNQEYEISRIVLKSIKWKQFPCGKLLFALVSLFSLLMCRYDIWTARKIIWLLTSRRLSGKEQRHTIVLSVRITLNGCVNHLIEKNALRIALASKMLRKTCVAYLNT